MQNLKCYNVILGFMLIALLALSIGLFMVEVWDPDFWWHLATGRWIVENGRLPDKDPFSFATIQEDPYTPVDRVKFILTQYWLSQIILYKIYALWGFAGISIFRALLLTLTIGMIILIMRHHRVHGLIILPIILADIFITRLFTGERPQLFSFLFAALLIYLLEGMRKADSAIKTPPSTLHPTPSTLLPLIMVLWSNLHGGYIYGVVIILIYIFSGWIEFIVRRDQREKINIKRHMIFTAVGVVAILCSFINPNTYGAFINTFIYRPSRYMSAIQEHLPTYKLYEENITYFIMLVLTTISMLINIRRLSIKDMLLFLFNAVISLISVRFIMFFVISGSFLLGKYLNMLLPLRYIKEKRYLEMVLTVVICLFIAGFVLTSKDIVWDKVFRTSSNTYFYPAGASEFMKNCLHPQRIFNAYAWGGYLIWRLYPDYKVFIDGRGLNQEIFLQYAEVTRVERSEQYAGRPKWKAILDGYNIDYIIMAPFLKLSSEHDLAYALANDKDWKLIYADDTALLFVRDNKRFEELIRKYSLPKDVVYAVTAKQALDRVKMEKTRRKKVISYLAAVDAFIRLDNREDARYTLKKAFELDPENSTIQSYLRALGYEPDKTQ